MLKELQTPVTDEQRLLLETVGMIYLRHGQWPNWAWVDETLEREGISASAVLSSLRREPSHGYGAVWPNQLAVPQPQGHIGLTIAGFRHLPLASTLVQDHLLLLDTLGAIRSDVSLDPFDTEWPQVSASQLVQAAFQYRHRTPGPIDRARLDFMQHEPATWQCHFVEGTDDEWALALSPQIRRFAGVKDVDDYLERLSLVLLPESTVDERPAFVSPFTLPAALDYLDAIWWRKFNAGLVVPPGLERSARLAFNVESAEEADSSLSALAEVLKAFQVPGLPGKGGHPLQRLGPFLSDHLSDEAMPAVNEAITILDAVRQVRAAAQHVGAESGLVDALTRLDLSYPVSDWPAAWGRIQQAVAYSCDVIRQEIHASL
jgi:hypothetical protein